MMMRMVKRTKGVGLLELMLSLAIIAVLLIMATRYFQGAQRNQEVNSAIQSFQEVYAACSQAQLDTPGTACTLANLVSLGELSAQFKADANSNIPANPFGGALTSSYSGGVQTIEMDGIPVGNKACEQIAQKLFSSLSGSQSLKTGAATYNPGTDNVSSVTCSGTTDNITVTY